MTNKVTLPIQTANAWPLRIRQPQDTSGGWSTIECESVEQAREIMAANPQASMPCWINPRAEWNRVRA